MNPNPARPNNVTLVVYFGFRLEAEVRLSITLHELWPAQGK